MNAATTSGLWEEILDLTATIGDRAMAGEWEEVIALDAERRLMLESFFASPPTRDEMVRQVDQGIRAILASDRMVMDLAHGMQQAIGEEMRTFRRGHEAAGAYLDQSNNEES